MDKLLILADLQQMTNQFDGYIYGSGFYFS